MSFVKLSAPSTALDQSLSAANTFLAGSAALDLLKTGNPAALITQMIATVVFKQQELYTNLSRIIGRPLPIIAYSNLEKQQAQDELEKFLKPDEVNAYRQINSQLDDIMEAIKEAHRNFNAYTSGAIRVSAEPQGSVEAPTGSKQRAQEMHRDLMEQINKGLKLASFYKDSFLPKIQDILRSRNENRGLVDATVERNRQSVIKRFREVEALYKEYYSFDKIFYILQEKREVLQDLLSKLPLFQSYANLQMSIQNANFKELQVALLQLKNQESLAQNVLLKEKDNLVKQYSTGDSKLIEFKNLKASNENIIKTNEYKPTGNLLFSNLIVEAQTNTSTYQYYVNAIVDPTKNNQYLYDFIINQENKLNQDQKNELINLIEQASMSKYSHFLERISDSQQMAPQDFMRFLISLDLMIDENKKLLNKDKNALSNLINLAQKGDYSFLQEPTSQPAAFFSTPNVGGVVTGIGGTVGTVGTGGTVSGTGLTGIAPGLVTEETELVSWYREFRDRLGQFGADIKVDPATLEAGPQAVIDSLNKQLLERTRNINELDAIYIKLMMDPTRLDFNLSHTSAKFIKVAEKNKDVVEADERLEEYYNEEMDYAPYGTILNEDPSLHPNLTFEEEKKLHNKKAKFKKID